MNRIFRLVWNESRNAYVPAAETARGRGKRSTRKLIAAALSLAAGIAEAAPTGGQVAGGSGTITQSGATTTIQQSSENLSLGWQTFNVAAQETVNFVQPNAGAIAVNRILDPNGTVILGHLNANGQIYLINPNGVLFGKGAEVDVGGLVASTLDLDGSIGDSTKHFSGAGTAEVVNEGTVTAANGGSVALLGNHVGNTGVIAAQLGTVALGAGSAATLTFAGTRLVALQVDRSVLDSMVANGGLIRADGGAVLMTAGAQKSLLASVVNNTGVIEARTVEDHAGTITLLGGMTAGTVRVGGTLDAAAPNGGDGGFVETSAAHVQIAPDAKVITAASMGLAGTWLIDPTDFTIAPTGGDETGAQLSTALGSGNVTIESSAGGSGTAGNVNVDDTVGWSAHTLTLVAQNNINLNSAMNGSGSASLALQYGQGAVNANNTSVYNVNAPVNLPSGAHFSTKLGSDGTTADFTVITSLGAAADATTAPATPTLQGIAAAANLGTNFALGANLDATATSAWNAGAGFTPIGTNSNQFTGIFDGLGHTVSNLYIHLPSSNYVAGLFGEASNLIQNVGLIDGSVTGGLDVGMLAGSKGGNLNNVYATGTVTGTQSGGQTGGLIGDQEGSYITDSYAAVAVSGTRIGGGLIGFGFFATINNSYATGAVSAAGYTGGLVGYHAHGTITDSYATGAASGTNNVGGLVGIAFSDTITQSYSTGHVSGTSYFGGLVGYATGATSSDSYWNTTTSGQNSSAEGTGLSSTQMQAAANFAGFTFTNTPGASGNAWVMVDADGSLNNAAGAGGATFPLLASEYSSSIVNAHQMQLMSMAPGANYTLAADVDASATALAVSNGHADVWSTAGGFVPVGTSSSNFNGSFDGLGHTIGNLAVDLPTMPYVGLFGFVGTSGVIANVNVIDANVTGGNSGNQAAAGILAGASFGHVTNAFTSGTMTESHSWPTGGLVGDNSGTVDGSHSSSTVSGLGGVGGLVGSNEGSITNSFATGAVTGQYNYIGGLVGTSTGAVNASYATGSVSGGGYAGGLVGANEGGSIANSHATGSVNCVTACTSSNEYMGGLVGFVNVQYSNNTPILGPVSNSYATGTVTGGYYVGGLVGGEVLSPISNSYSTGAVVGLAEVGGLIGNWLGSSSGGTLSNSFYDIDRVTINGVHQVTMGGIYDAQYQDWFTHGQTLNVANYAATLPAGTGGYYDVGSVQGLRDMLGFVESDAADNFRLTGDLSLPAGFSFPYFAGSFDGGNHTLTNLSLNVPNSDVGLFGYLPSSSTTIANVGVPGANVTGRDDVGGLVGLNTAAAISNSYVSGSVNGSSYVGGLVGYNRGGSISNSYSSASVTASSGYGGGGLAGANYGAISKSYATGSVSASSYVGGLVGVNYGTVANSYYDKTANPTLTGLSNYSGPIADAPGVVSGLTTAQLYSQSSFSGWDFGSTWFMYQGATTPLLRAFMTPLTVSANDATKTYSAGAYAGGNGVSYTTTAGDGNVLGSPTYGGTSQGAVSAGTYSITPGGLYSDQQGYIIGYASGSLTIAPAPLTVAGSTAGKVYDGTTAAPLSGGVLVGVLGGDAVTLTQAGTFASKNVGTGIAVSASDGIGGASAGDYTLIEPTGLTGNITPAPLTVSGSVVGGKVYDGNTLAAISGGSLVGVFGVDAVTLSQGGSFASKNVGTAIGVTASDALGGSQAGDYTLVEPSGLTGNISPASLAVSGTTVASKPYDGTAAASLTRGSLVGVVSGDSVTLNQSGAFASSSPGTGIAVTATDSLSGASAGDYRLIEPTGLTASILPPPSPPGGGGGPSGPSAPALAAQNASAQTEANLLYPQLGATPQLVDASPSIQVIGTSADEAGGAATGDAKSHKAIAVNVSMKIGATGTLKIENGGLRLPNNLVVGNE